jgi:hypothetical protein
MATETTVTFFEATAFTGVGADGFRLDTEAGIAHGVAICGAVSANGRDYPDAVRDRDKGIYEGANVFLNHSATERGVKEWFGVIRNPRTRVSDRKTIADFHYPKHSQFTAEFEERATKFSGSFGFSHVAVCETKRVNGRESITRMARAESVDLVARPATNKSLYESERPMDDAEKRLTEAQSEVAALKESVTALTKQTAELAEQVKTLTAEKATLVKEAADAKLAALIGDTKLTDVQRKAVGLLTDEADRKALVESLKSAAAGEKPVSGEKNGGKTVTEAVTVPTDGAAFAKFIS